MAGGLDDLVRDMVSVGNDLSADLQVSVTHRQVTAVDTYGKATASTDTVRTALVDDAQRQVRTTPRGINVDGTEVQQKFDLTFLGKVDVDPENDTFVLADGRTGPILDVKGFADPAGGRYFTIVTIGAGSSGAGR